MLWEEIAHPEHEQSSVAEMLEHERTHLMPMPEPFDGYVEKPARVSSTCLVAVARNRYSVPCELAGQMVSTRLYPGRVVVVAHDSVVAGHERLHAAGQTRYDWQHYLPLLQRKPGALRNGAQFAAVPAPLQQLRQALLRHAGICSRSVLIFSRSRSVLASTSAGWVRSAVSSAAGSAPSKPSAARSNSSTKALTARTGLSSAIQSSSRSGNSTDCDRASPSMNRLIVSSINKPCRF